METPHAMHARSVSREAQRLFFDHYPVSIDGSPAVEIRDVTSVLLQMPSSLEVPREDGFWMNGPTVRACGPSSHRGPTLYLSTRSVLKKVPPAGHSSRTPSVLSPEPVRDGLGRQFVVGLPKALTIIHSTAPSFFSLAAHLLSQFL